MPRESNRGRLRSHEACLNCRRKKIRCPAEKPACSSCLRLGQACLYTPVRRTSRGGQSEDRLASLEEKVNLILRGSRPVDQVRDKASTAPSERSGSLFGEPGGGISDLFSSDVGSEESTPHPSTSTIARGINLYFQFCHRQPIWCFDREELEESGCDSQELVCSILALASRFSRDHDHLHHYSNTARTLIMLRVANGTVDLETMESLCLLSYLSFVEGNVSLGRFHLGLAFQLCRSAALDLESTYVGDSGLLERKKRLFWSLQSLEQCYGEQNGFLSAPATVRRPFPAPGGDDHGFQRGLETQPPPLPRDDLGCTTADDLGIWSLAVHFGWVWSRVRSYVSNCADNRLKEPWRHDSMYAMVLSDLTEVENHMPQCHRYDSVKFYERTADELRTHRNYWAPWLKIQFTYHCILTVLNHPFLYIVASQYNPTLTIPNAFWRRSSELVLLHATWLVRMIDMVSDKQMRLIDPFFGHCAAIAATVHLYFCCAADPRLKQKSKTDFAKCRRFLESFATFSPVCRALNQTLDKMLRIASGADRVDYDWTPSKIYLSVPLMWDVLQVDCVPDTHRTTAGLLHPSLVPTIARDHSAAEHFDSTLEIIVAMSPEVTVNTADGGTAAHMPPHMARLSPSPSSSRGRGSSSGGDRAPASGGVTGGSIDPLVAPADSLMLNTPWLWTDPGQFTDLENMDYQEAEAAIGNVDGFSTWWDFGNL
ncbi:putative C6 transcription factor [Aspergillus candidus]|uniref:Zn(2)-C6 fungal-type domain-containing protein n=1 Tax=Aspergillus candidus TaxID=41067 RepID=A0A2I2FIB5_ASPCN|nr:hypothetical protein BDW47DRAFT_135142 [Aspergillus candidus]PLB40366.1 hypothetical protein BDW47DRAFT_135142 [Aspergillus candidus]